MGSSSAGAASSIISLSRIVKADHRASATRGGERACDQFVQLEFGRNATESGDRREYAADAFELYCERTMVTGTGVMASAVIVSSST